MDNRAPTNLSEWSAAVRARDGQCRRCGVTDPLVAHHIMAKSEYPELALDVDNGETLCPNCHTAHHRNHRVANSARQSTGERAALRRKVKELQAKVETTGQRLSELEHRVADLERQLTEERGRANEYETAYSRLVAWDA